VLHAQGHVELAKTLLGVTVATPCVLLLWLSRRSALVEQPGFHVAAASFTYTIIVVGGSYGLHKLLPLTAATAFLWMAAGATVTSAVQLWRLRPVLNTRQSRANVRSVWSSHWGYGRWAILTALAQWASSNSYYFALTGSHGIALSGYLRALLNFALPLMQTMVALMWVVQPHAVRVLEKQGVARLKMLVAYITVAYVGLAAFYWGTILLVNRELIHLLYGGRYSELRYWLPALALSSILQMAGQGVAVGLRAIDLPSAIFRANLCSAAVTFAIGLPSVLIFGVPGAIAGMIVANAVALIAQAVLLLRKAPAREPEAVACAS
jgi:O-antigen/teichoic acid export membrane protein